MMGSSPLARGLPTILVVGSRKCRIIPARAGFTFQGGWRGCDESDHPRSRGVYHKLPETHAKASGSSPLARGLRSQTRRRRHIHGIIPARAGFTAGPPRPLRGSPDHPRSRGVYVIGTLLVAYIGGSSPLARGLRCRYDLGWLARGIIPARAGFTPR